MVIISYFKPSVFGDIRPLLVSRQFSSDLISTSAGHEFVLGSSFSEGDNKTAMGVIIGKVFQKQKDPETPDFITPTPKQIQIIKDTWEVPKANITDTGEIILFRFLDDFPSNQKKFQAFANVPLLSLKVRFKEDDWIRLIDCHSIPGYSRLPNAR